MQQKMYSLGEVAQKIGIAPYKVTYAITTGLVSDASMRFAGKRVFSVEDVERLAQHFGVNSLVSERESDEEAE